MRNRHPTPLPPGQLSGTRLHISWPAARKRDDPIAGGKCVMTVSGIWTKAGEGWTLSLPDGFPDEATLHDLIEQTPEMLPLSGAPPLLILGREVPLGSGYADLVGVETSGRPVIVEIKLEKNSDARRTVVAQILAYAAHLHGTTREQLEDLVGASLTSPWPRVPGRVRWARYRRTRSTPTSSPRLWTSIFGRAVSGSCSSSTLCLRS